MRILLIAEHNNYVLKKTTLSTLSAAQLLRGEIHILVLGYKIYKVVLATAQLTGVSKVYFADALQFTGGGLTENVVPTILSIANQYSYIMLSSTTYGKNIAPQLAAKLNVSQISEISKIIDANTFERPIYAGTIIATVQSDDIIKILTVRSANFKPWLSNSNNNVLIEEIQTNINRDISKIITQEIKKYVRPELNTAQIVIAGGRGLGSYNNYSTLLEPLADKLGAALGASRAAVDAGFAPNNYQIGQTGKIIAPELYIAIGISGAVQHLEGIKNSQVIVAINHDPTAPIFGVSDYGMVGDLFTIIPKLILSL